MPRKTVGGKKTDDSLEAFDYSTLIHPGVTMLKFGRSGNPHERHFTLSRDLRYLEYSSGWFTSKLGGTNVIDLEKVSQIMQGQNTFQFQRFSALYGDSQDKSFSIIYRNDDNEEKTLDLMAPSPEIFKMWFTGISLLLKSIQEKRKKFSLDALYLKSLWEKADADHSGTLTSKEVIQLIASININFSSDTIKEMYNKFDVDKNGLLDFDEFVEFISFLRRRPDIEAIWEAVVSNVSLFDPSIPLNVDNACKTKDASISLAQFVRFW